MLEPVWVSAQCSVTLTRRWGFLFGCFALFFNYFLTVFGNKQLEDFPN